MSLKVIRSSTMKKIWLGILSQQKIFSRKLENWKMHQLMMKKMPGNGGKVHDIFHPVSRFSNFRFRLGNRWDTYYSRELRAYQLLHAEQHLSL